MMNERSAQSLVKLYIAKYINYYAFEELQFYRKIPPGQLIKWILLVFLRKIHFNVVIYFIVYVYKNDNCFSVGL